MRDVEIPNWLKRLPFAPEFRPTETEFADPIAYISKIEKEASVFGICKVIPPLPRPSKKYVVANLSKSLLKRPELGDDVGSLVKGDKGCKGESRAVFTTRQQELGVSGKKGKGGSNGQRQLPSAHKHVWQSGEIYTLEQFEAKSKTFAKSQLSTVKDVSPLVIETLFWKASREKPIYIEYANDVPGSGFGELVDPSRCVRRCRRRRKRGTFTRNNRDCSDFNKDQVYKISSSDDTKGEPEKNIPDSSVEISKASTSSSNMISDQISMLPRQKVSDAGNEMEGSSGWKLSNSAWNLQVIARSPGSLTRFMPDDIPGVTSPMIYIGMLFSWFAWHVEDHELHSLNFLHTGSSKTWYSIPGDYAFTFEEVIRTHAYGGNIDRLAALTLLGEKTTLLSPEVIVASGIPCCRLVQNPGEFVVTFPRAYHIGFSHGFNCGEAANFSTPKWLTIAKEAAVRRAAMNHLPMLSHQQLLYLLTMSFISRVPRSLLPGVRSSRLRDRQKDERELSVKKAFVEDILNENKLLTTLLKKSSSYHAVLWDLDSLPSSEKESHIHSDSNLVSIKDGHSEKDIMKDPYRDLNLFSESIDDPYVGDDDMSSDFQVDSGSLPCVACGVLGFPFMCVVQPCEAAFLDTVTTDDHIVQNLSVQSSMDSHSASDLNSAAEGSVSDLSPPIKDSPHSIEAKHIKEWNTSSRYLRPRIFCLEHARQTKEMLSSKGGAKVLVICHSDFQKVKAHAAAIAEQISTPFLYNEIPLDNASQDDLHLINLAIDDEEQRECEEDWTTELNINMQHCVKICNKSSSEKVQHALTLDGLFADSAPCADLSIIDWKARKTRSRRNLNKTARQTPSKSIITVHEDEVLEVQSDPHVGRNKDEVLEVQSDPHVGRNKDEVLEVQSDPHVGRKGGCLIQYSRRRFKSKLHGSITELGTCERQGNGSSELGLLNESSSEKVLLGTSMELETENSDARSTGNEPTPSNVTSVNGSTAEEIHSSDNECSLQTSSEAHPRSISKSRSRKGSKRKREVDSLIEDQLGMDGFIRSPCEGLRSRNKKEITGEKPPSTKKVKKPVTDNNSHVNKLNKQLGNGSHKRDTEGSKKNSLTKIELALKRNKCPYNGCGKKFRSYKYAMLHLRVHEDERPLKCSWKGCKMTFKWAWARTEHLRVHTGERPYKCKVDGCGLTFRFVSDYSRHRRKTGHYVEEST